MELKMRSMELDESWFHQGKEGGYRGEVLLEDRSTGNGLRLGNLIDLPSLPIFFAIGFSHCPGLVAKLLILIRITHGSLNNTIFPVSEILGRLVGLLVHLRNNS